MLKPLQPKSNFFMQKERKDKHFIKKPIYKGGKKALKDFITQSLQYPKEALAAKVEGTVIVKYTVNYLGKVIDSKVISGLGHGCDEEAQRVVKLLTFDVPTNRGVKVLHHLNIQIHFKLKKVVQQKTSTSPPANVQYNYVITSTPSKKDEPKEAKPKPAYKYTVKVS